MDIELTGRIAGIDNYGNFVVHFIDDVGLLSQKDSTSKRALDDIGIKYKTRGPYLRNNNGFYLKRGSSLMFTDILIDDPKLLIGKNVNIVARIRQYNMGKKGWSINATHIRQIE